MITEELKICSDSNLQIFQKRNVGNDSDTVLRKVQILQIPVRVEMLDGFDVISFQIQMGQMDQILQPFDGQYSVVGQVQLAQTVQPAHAVHPQQLVLAEGQLKKKKKQRKQNQ